MSTELIDDDDNKVWEKKGTLPNWSGDTIPYYIQKAPWYYKDEGIGHLKLPSFAIKKVTPRDEHYSHGQNREVVIHHWKPGCCKNCGSPNHTEFECLERPRKKNARAIGLGKSEKEIIDNHDLSYEAKHDQYANVNKDLWWFTARSHYNLADKIRAQHSDDYSGKIQIQEEFGNHGFRNREDIPRYLLEESNVPGGADENDMFVKPELTQKSEEPKENLKGLSGKESREMMEARAIEEQHKRDFQERWKLLNESQVSEAPISEQIPLSERYGNMENVTINGHKAVWGSWFHDGQWGYACCHQTKKDSICPAND